MRLITDDVSRLADFYELVTGGIAARNGDVFAELRTSLGTLAIGSTRTVPAFAPGAAEGGNNRSAIIEFLTADVDAEYARLRDVVDSWVNEPTDMPWGNRSLLRDPDGNLVNLFTPVTPAAVEKFARFSGGDDRHRGR
ncbi:VOC family protein [Microbacterium suwonense]|uniref:Glyoxalase n=1 Tax=Microbacterium suwonense TaxID=683047 RepID=A0ABN6X5X1_9MICO|nr:VOC family protein [Microbacterium suwonense]BDZ40132.1 glyoxalase [Microbacterium suwonense]